MNPESFLPPIDPLRSEALDRDNPVNTGIIVFRNGKKLYWGRSLVSGEWFIHAPGEDFVLGAFHDGQRIVEHPSGHYLVPLDWLIPERDKQKGIRAFLERLGNQAFN
jgi:hypothetical protein